ncbi:MAG: thioredoxin family protein [Planctomycetes bacterium]|nr:thioredoxin family protein [Planctomycetota bacterium]
MVFARLCLILLASCALLAANPSPGGTSPGLGLPTLLDLGSTACIPCKRMAPILEALEKEFAGRLTVTFVDVRNNPKAAKTWRIEVIPTQIFIDASGRELFRHTGVLTREEILATWKELGVDLGEAVPAGVQSAGNTAPLSSGQCVAKEYAWPGNHAVLHGLRAAGNTCKPRGPR